MNRIVKTNYLITSNIPLTNRAMAQEETAPMPSPFFSKKAAFRKFAAESALLITAQQNQAERNWDEILKDFQDLSKPLMLSDKEADRILAFYGISDINVRDPDKVVEKLPIVADQGGFPIDEIVRDGLNPLEKAVFANNAPLVRLLLSKGVSPLMERKFSGKNFIHQVAGYTTAICDAIELRNMAVIQQFVDAGLDPSVNVFSQKEFFWGVPGVTWQRRTALEFAKEFGNDSVAAMILGSLKKNG